MSAFLLPLLYLTSGRGGACDYLDCFVAAHYFCRGTCEGLRLGHPRWLYPQKNTFSKKFEYISGKSITEAVSLPRKCFFYGEHPIIGPAANRLFYKPAQHLVHHRSVGLLHHNIYPAKKVSPL